MNEQHLDTVRKAAQYVLDQLDFSDANGLGWKTYGDESAVENWIWRREVEELLSLVTVPEPAMLRNQQR